MRLIKTTALAAAIMAMSFIASPTLAATTTTAASTTAGSTETTTTAAPPPSTTADPDAPKVAQGKTVRAVDHRSGGITASKTRFFIGTDTGTIEERSFDMDLVNVRNDYSFKNDAGATTTTKFSNETNRMGGFTQMDDIANDVFYFCSEDDNAVYRYATQTHVMTRMAGNGEAGLTAGTGKAARIDCGASAGNSARNTARTKVYVFSGAEGATGSTWGIVAVTVNSATTVDNAALTIVSGNTNGHVDGAAGTAKFRQLHGMLYFKESTNEYLIMGFSDAAGAIRVLNLGTAETTTAPLPYHATEHLSGTDGAAKLPNVVGLIGYPGKPFGYGVTANRVFTLSWNNDVTSFTVEFQSGSTSGKWGAAIASDASRLFFGNSVAGDGELLRYNLVDPEDATPESSGTPEPEGTEGTEGSGGPGPLGPGESTNAPNKSPAPGSLTTNAADTPDDSLDSATGASLFAVATAALGALVFA